MIAAQAFLRVFVAITLLLYVHPASAAGARRSSATAKHQIPYVVHHSTESIFKRINDEIRLNEQIRTDTDYKHLNTMETSEGFRRSYEDGRIWYKNKAKFPHLKFAPLALGSGIAWLTSPLAASPKVVTVLEPESNTYKSLETAERDNLTPPITHVEPQIDAIAQSIEAAGDSPVVLLFHHRLTEDNSYISNLNETAMVSWPELQTRLDDLKKPVILLGCDTSCLSTSVGIQGKVSEFAVVDIVKSLKASKSMADVLAAMTIASPHEIEIHAFIDAKTNQKFIVIFSEKVVIAFFMGTLLTVLLVDDSSNCEQYQRADALLQPDLLRRYVKCSTPSLGEGRMSLGQRREVGPVDQKRDTSAVLRETCSLFSARNGVGIDHRLPSSGVDVPPGIRTMCEGLDGYR